jgi:hypothetical protein
LALVAKVHQDQLDRLKKNVEGWFRYFRSNNQRYTESRSFLFKTGLDMNDRGIADELQRPQLEVNVLETYVSHMVGEMAKQTPSPSIQPIRQDPQLADQAMVIEDHIRYIFTDARPVQINAFRNTLSGGFSAVEVGTEYLHPESSQQKICIKSILEDTQVGFDPTAKKSHKGDGRFCFKNVPKTKEDLAAEIPGIDLDEIEFDSALTDRFPWYYLQPNGNANDKIVVICDYFEKKAAYKWLYQCSDPMNPDNTIDMTKDKYDKLLELYAAHGILTAPPVILNKMRRPFVTIVHYQFTGDQVILYEETDYDDLPIVYIDGNSILLTEGQFTRPYTFHAMDPQRMKNVCAQSIMNDIENMRQTDIFIAKEAIPQESELRLAWLNPQKASAALAYNYFSETNDGATLPMPQVFQRQQVAPTTLQIYQMMDQSIQATLGSYDAQQGLQNDMSGIAIENGAMQSNNSAMPYIINYVEAMQRVCEIIVGLIPKYYKTLRTIPTINSEGIKGYKVINNTQTNPIFKLEYDRNDLQVDVKMDQNFEVQKARFVQTVGQLMKISPLLNEFFSTDGVPMILDNIQMKDIAKVKQSYSQFAQRKQMQMQQQQKMQMQMNPSVVQRDIAQMKTQTDEKKLNVDLIKTLLEKRIEDRKAESSEAATQAQVLESQGKLAIAAFNANAENKRSDVEAAIAMDRHFNDKLQQQRDHELKMQEMETKIAESKISKEAKTNDKAKSKSKK